MIVEHRSSAPQSYGCVVSVTCPNDNKFSTPILHKLCMASKSLWILIFTWRETDRIQLWTELCEIFFSSDDTTAIMVKYSSTVWEISSILSPTNSATFVATPTLRLPAVFTNDCNNFHCSIPLLHCGEILKSPFSQLGTFGYIKRV